MIREERRSPFITPTYQSVLNHNLLALTDSLNNSDFGNSYERLRTLIYLMNPKDQKDFIENELNHIEAELKKARSIEGVDLYNQRRNRNFATERILRRRVLPLFQKVMERLHKGGYLEIERRRIGRPDFDRLEKDAVEDEVDPGQPQH